MSGRKVDSKEIGLIAGLRFLNHFFHTDYLHYGYWRDGLPVEVLNLKLAQQAYSEFLYAFIPTATRSILDVGCGSGRVALELIQRGYRVDCISPSEKLTEFATRLLGDKARIIRGRFETVPIEGRYDLVLFSESFQYIPMTDALNRSRKLLNTGGHILISDFFRKDDVPGKSSLGGGHSLSEFWRRLDEAGLEVIRQEDITARVAPTIDLVNGITMEVIHPLYNDLGALLRDRFPLISKFLRWKYRKKLDKIENKHFRGERNAANFRKYKTYLTVLARPRP